MLNTLSLNLLFLLVFYATDFYAQILPIIPKPNQIKFNEGKFNFNKGLDIKIIRGDEATKQIAAQLTSFLESKNVKIDRYSISSITINLTKDTTIAKDGYTLSVSSNNIAIASSSNLGLFYGMQSAKQLFANDTSKGKNISCVDIIDEPFIKFRGLQLDAVSTFFDAKSIKKILDEMTMLKMNSFHLLLANDDVCRMELKNLPALTDTDFMIFKQIELSEIVKYASERYISVLPEFNFATTQNILTANYPTDSLLFSQKKILDELISIFPNPSIHIGDDGLNTDDLIVYLESKNKKAIINSNKNRKFLTSEVTLLVTKNIKTVSELSETNLIIGAPKPICAFENMVDWEDSKKSKNMQFLPIDKVYKFDPLINVKNSKNLKGIEAVILTSYISKYNELEYQLFPRLYAFEECLWTKKAYKKFSDFEKRLLIIGYPGKKDIKINMVKFK